MENTLKSPAVSPAAPAYHYEVNCGFGDSRPTAFFVTVEEAIAHCERELNLSLTDEAERAHFAAVLPGQQLRMRGQGLRWLSALRLPVPLAAPAPRYNEGVHVRPFGEPAWLTVQERHFSAGSWQYLLCQGAGTFAEALLFPPGTAPTPPAAVAETAPLDAPQATGRPVAREPLLFSLHTTELMPPAAANFPLPPRLFLQTSPAGPARIVALCGTTGKRFVTTAYDAGPYQLTGGQQYPTRQALADFFRSQHARMLPAQGVAMLLGVDGSLQEIRPDKGRKSFKLPQLYAALAADLVDVYCPQHGPYEGYLLVYDDEGKYRQRPINPLATALWYETYPLDQYAPVDVVAGPVLLMKSNMMR